jgi:murein DD-endopeptidase MepM/ murein hydrolase activator NlpD
MIVAVGIGPGCWSGRPAHPEPPLGRWYEILPGETLGDIARRNGVQEEDLLEVNGLRSAAEARPGRTIFVLAPPPPVGGAAVGDSTAAAGEGGGQERPPAAVLAGTAARLRWPVDAPRVTSLFGSRWGRAHEGIDLVAPVGTPVVAADAGEVVYAGNSVRGYGNMVVLRHRDDLMTVYAHNSVLLVKVGAVVQAGDRIALSGQSGHATGPHVHFEVRHGQTPRDPLQFLPGGKGRP